MSPSFQQKKYSAKILVEIIAKLFLPKHDVVLTFSHSYPLG